jgi:gliding motility-associated-like protein
MKKTFFFFNLLLFTLIFQQVKAQSFAREVIGSAGTFATSPYGSMEWTIGEVMIETFVSADYYFTQGFHQPSVVAIVPNPNDFFIPEGFSPNSDGINDLLVIRGIENYPNNKIEIFNRWGQKVFEESPYTNNWNGHSQYGITIGGDELPIGTYFYLLDLGLGSTIFKGTIYLNR